MLDFKQELMEIASAKMKSIVCIFLIILHLLTANGISVVDYVPPIKGFIQMLDLNVRISALVCWNYGEKYDFLGELNREEERFQVLIKPGSVENMPSVDDERQHLIVTDLRCPESVSLYHKVSSFRWIAIISQEINLSDYFDDVPLQINSEVYCLNKTGDTFNFYEVYKKTLDSEVSISSMASFREGHIVDERIHPSIVQRRKNFQGITLRASLVVTNNNTLNHLHDYREKHIDTITKSNYRLTNFLMEYLNATIRYKFVSQWGYMNSQTGKWSGMIGDLVENRSDIGATALFMTSDRIKYIDYISMPTPTLSKFVFRSPKLSYTDDVFLLPFDKFVWYCLVGLFFISAIFLIGTVIIEWHCYSSVDDSKNAANLQPSFYDTCILVFAAICQQGSSVVPRSITARIVMVVTYITLMFLYTSYSGNITALLQSPSTKIQTLEDLLHSRLKFGVDDTVFNRYYFPHATEPIRKKIYEQKIRQNDGSENFLPLAEGVERIRHGLFAFHMELGVGYKLMGETYLEHEKCGLQEIQYLQVIDPWYAIQKNSSYKEFLKAGMLRLRELGLQDRENSRLYTKKPQCLGGGGKFITASLIDIRSALLVLVYGFIISISLLGIEKVVYYYVQKRKIEAKY